jgi:hypothetical protein
MKTCNTPSDIKVGFFACDGTFEMGRQHLQQTQVRAWQGSWTHSFSRLRTLLRAAIRQIRDLGALLRDYRAESAAVTARRHFQ